jgi:hypothetical protein
MSKKKNKKKNDKIIEELRRLLERNDYWCNYNDCKPSEYMEGVNDTSKRMIKFIKKLNKK